MSKKKFGNYLGIGIGLLVSLNGVVEFDRSNTWLEAFKGLFWIFIGMWCIWSQI